ncbi:MAG: Fic family protein [Methanobacterium paludis]|nr:Fic family protein [Methanobacterium paludis]
MKLHVPMPNQLSVISKKHKKYTTPDWQVYTPRYQPNETLFDQLVFAIKYEGINLLVFKKLFESISREEVSSLVQIEPLGQYSRKIWFLYEWLMSDKLPLPDLHTGNYITLLNESKQFGLENGAKSSRHRIINNLPGTLNFCPLISKTDKLEQYLASNLVEQNKNYLNDIHKDILLRTSAFLLLKDSKASFTIEGEKPINSRATRWGKAIGQAGISDLTKAELLRLQQIVIENTRFVEMGLRRKGGFVGEHDRVTGEPIPSHISAKWQDIDTLIEGLLKTNELLLKSNFDPVLSATLIAFGFVFIHPFEDGNGRIHRYLIHHMLAKKQFIQQGIIFPISASILNHIDNYRKTLEAYSDPLSDLIQWKETYDHNVEVLNDTIDFYRYFDATPQAEFLYDCVKDTIENIIPQEIRYLIQYDEFKQYLDNEYEMPDRMVALLLKFLEQNNGRLSKRAKEKEFPQLTDIEVQDIEHNYEQIFKT